MLLFRSEEHVDRWLAAWRMERGGLLTLSQIWGLARAWYAADRRDPSWRRRTPEEVREVFEGLGLKGAFWSLG
jgi:hypothetical protein